jgi:hypothetical protein
VLLSENNYSHKVYRIFNYRKIMEALKAGAEKVKEVVEQKKAEEKFEKAHDPNVKPSERLDAKFEGDKAAVKAAEHHAKAEHHHAKHVID